MRTTHVLFDFFGTLVEYQDSWTEQGYARTHGLLVHEGATLDYPAFLRAVAQLFAEHERTAASSLQEYSLEKVFAELARRTLRPGALGRGLVGRLSDTYLEEWNAGVRPISGVAAMLRELASERSLVVVSNTLHAAVVHDHLRAMGIDQYFSAVVTSHAHGKRKPSPCIFTKALELAGASASTAVHVGDSYEADYRGAAAAGITCLLIDPERRHDIPETHRLRTVLEVQERMKLPIR